MKKLLSLVIAVVLGIGTIVANPVDVTTAKSLGQKFVQANFEKTTRADLQLYYTVTSDNGEPCVYVFNLGNEGFVMVAASDNVRPVLAYSENGPFDATNPYNGAMFMLETYKNSISYAIEKNINATPEIAGQWESLRNCGKLSNKKAHTVGPLVQTKWNQDSPYNLYAPTASGGPGGRCYAGCVATAMSQVMKYWEHPAQGTGSHTYYCPGYGQQSANFGATTYHWDLMPRSLSGATQAQIEAVATLMYHCGVAVDMGFAPDGSGAYSQDVPAAMANYFDYNYCVQKQRSSYSLANWVNLLKAEFDLGRPVYYSGHSSEGGHAFVADGYHRAIGNQLHCIFVDNGLLRKNEFRDVLESYRDMGLNVKGVDASARFYEVLAGVTDPEKKRKAIGKTFIDVFDAEAKQITDAKWLGQGTIYPDVIESSSVKGPSQTIKSHHNVGGLPDYMKLQLVEPLRSLFKDEVRRVGRQLGIKQELIGRHPFPGPGLAIRILSDITPEKVHILQEVDHIFIQGLRQNGLYDKVWQAGCMLLPVQSVGVMGDERTYESVVALRAVESVDGMTADWSHLPYDFLARVSNDIINQVKGVNRVVYDISSKPPATIEWE